MSFKSINVSDSLAAFFLLVCVKITTCVCVVVCGDSDDTYDGDGDLSHICGNHDNDNDVDDDNNGDDARCMILAITDIANQVECLALETSQWP